LPYLADAAKYAAPSEFSPFLNLIYTRRKQRKSQSFERLVFLCPRKNSQNYREDCKPGNRRCNALHPAVFLLLFFELIRLVALREFAERNIQNARNNLEFGEFQALLVFVGFCSDFSVGKFFPCEVRNLR